MLEIIQAVSAITTLMFVFIGVHIIFHGISGDDSWL